MKNIDKLPHHKQMAIFYEASGFHRSKIASLLGVGTKTIGNWRHEPLYQAALQDTMNELKERVFGEHTSGIKLVLQGMLHESIKRVQEEDLESLPTDRLIKSLNIIWQIYNQMGQLGKGSESKDGSGKTEEVDPLAELKSKLKRSPTGQEYLGDKENK